MIEFRVPSPTDSTDSFDSAPSSCQQESTDIPHAAKMSLTAEELSQIRLLLSNQTNPTPTLRTAKIPPKESKKSPSKWPEWDGAKESYNTYIEQLAIKIEVDWELLGGHKAVCNDMMSTIPTEKRNRVAAWFSSGGPDGNWDFELFIEHFNDNFQDKTSARAAGENLSRMRQGQHQTFAAYLNDFEFLLAQARGLKWEGRVKVNFLSAGLNERLIDYLVSVRLPEDDYTSYVNEVKSVATRLEAKEDYLPRRGPKFTETWFITRAGTISHDRNLDYQKSHRATTDPARNQVDYEGDTPMSGINGISISTLTAIVNAIKAQGQDEKQKGNSRPPAPWRSPEEFAELKAAGKCTRCAKNGHFFKRCPSFTWAKRPTNLNANSVGNPRITSSRIDELDDDSISGKD